jgi:hypothetical protein
MPPSIYGKTGLENMVPPRPIDGADAFMKFKPILSVAHSCADANLSAVALARPNIVFILAENLRYDDVHWLNPDRGKIATPSPDRLAVRT